MGSRFGDGELRFLFSLCARREGQENENEYPKKKRRTERKR